MKKHQSKVIDLTKGNIITSLIVFMLPILASSLFQQLYTTVDAVIVGHAIGKAGLAAIDSVSALLRLPVNFLVGLSSGATIVISQYLGADKKAETEEMVETVIFFSTISGIIISLLGFLLTPYFLNLISIPDTIYNLTLSYTRIIFSGFVFSMLYNVLSGIFRSFGDSRTPFIVLSISGIMNLLLDILFVVFFKSGVSGAAIATILSQLISVVLLFINLLKDKDDFNLKLAKIKFSASACRIFIVLGFPIGLQAAFYPVANMFVQSSINSLGTDSITAWAICQKLDFLIMTIIDSAATAVMIFTAQNYGKNNLKRVRKGIGLGLIATVLIVISLSLVMYIFSRPLSTLFINVADYNVLPLTVSVIRFIAPFYFLHAVAVILSYAIRGVGDTLKPMLLSLIGTCMTRILWISLVVKETKNLQFILYTYPVSWGFTAILMILLILSKKRGFLHCKKTHQF